MTPDSLGRVDYADRYSVELPKPMEAPRFCSLILQAAPRWLDVLLSMRDSVAGRFGFNTQERNYGKPVCLAPGGKFGPLLVQSVSPQQVVCGDSDKHLTFRATFETDPARAWGSLTTEVRYNDAVGRAYFAVVKPFHKRVIPALLAAPFTAPRACRADGEGLTTCATWGDRYRAQLQGRSRAAPVDGVGEGRPAEPGSRQPPAQYKLTLCRHRPTPSGNARGCHAWTSLSSYMSTPGAPARAVDGGPSSSTAAFWSRSWPVPDLLPQPPRRWHRRACFPQRRPSRRSATDPDDPGAQARHPKPEDECLGQRLPAGRVQHRRCIEGGRSRDCSGARLARRAGRFPQRGRARQRDGDRCALRCGAGRGDHDLLSRSPTDGHPSCR